VTALSVPDLATILRGAGYDAYADRIDTAQQTSNSSTEFLYQGRQILVDLLREQPNMHRDRVDEVHTVVANLSALLNDAGDASH
jgi:hypothetical protein